MHITLTIIFKYISFVLMGIGLAGIYSLIFYDDKRQTLFLYLFVTLLLTIAFFVFGI
jgi:hypothetical protein